MEVERFQNALMLFRGSVREWTDKLDHSEFPVHEAIVLQARGKRAGHRAPMAWVLAAAAFAAAVAVPMYQDSRDRELKAQAERDAQLMDDVNAQLSRSGPLAMDPLMQLMTDSLCFPLYDGGNLGARRRQLHSIIKAPKYDPLTAAYAKF